MFRAASYRKFTSVCMITGVTLMLLVTLQESHIPREQIKDSEKTDIVRWLLGNDHDDVHSQHEHSRMVISKTLYPITNGHFFINNPNLCRVDKVSIIVMVHTAPDHFFIRSEMRRTWLNQTFYSPERVVTVYLLGTVKDAKIQEKIVNESRQYGDIIQGDFLDSYRNLTNKGVMGYRWITEYCRNAEIMVKVDDDALINFFKLFETLKPWLKTKKKHIFCNRHKAGTMPIIRKHDSKWYVNEDEYKDFKFFPHPYCSGFVVFISMDLVPMLYQAAIGSPFFWVDDFFLFGLLPSRVKNVTYTTFTRNLTFSHPVAERCYRVKGQKCPFVIMPAKNKEIDVMWKGVTKNMTLSKYGYYYIKQNIHNQPNHFAESYPQYKSITNRSPTTKAGS